MLPWYLHWSVGISADGISIPRITTDAPSPRFHLQRLKYSHAAHLPLPLRPNAELLAAIKDVVAKFKASLDETGIDQDVRLMGNQLRNTWQQLRTGLDRGLRAVKQSAETSLAQANIGPMNEQLGRLLDKAADDANRVAVSKRIQ
ncbi:hypothetical protein ANCDUO_02039 [Ancylostoma duodenale]|uniref:Uncharacterized protein n=1 Tax=Ancylostoma duodenale TaxID=51022 RepID=A0A0C2HDK4_9BILA|nr:hypothetical protein ANCDUO_02039 [Ancylostoma duodenale]